LYCTLSAWERDHLDSFYSSETILSEVTVKTVAHDKVIEDLATIPETVLVTPDSFLDECVPSTTTVDTLDVTNPVLPEILLAEGSPLLPGYGEPAASEHSLDRMLSDLVPSYREVTSPVPIPTFLGKVVVVSGGPSDVATVSGSSEVSSGKDLAWSRGLGLELSPVKTRSARKKWVQTFPFRLINFQLLLTRGRLEALNPSQGKNHDSSLS
jgi:hypothetical protein